MPFSERRYLIPFRATLLPQIFTDVLVIGAGVAGCSAALTAVRESDSAEVIVTTDAGTYRQRLIASRCIRAISILTGAHSPTPAIMLSRHCQENYS